MRGRLRQRGHQARCQRGRRRRQARWGPHRASELRSGPKPPPAPRWIVQRSRPAARAAGRLRVGSLPGFRCSSGGRRGEPTLSRLPGPRSGLQPVAVQPCRRIDHRGSPRWLPSRSSRDRPVHPVVLGPAPLPRSPVLWWRPLRQAPVGGARLTATLDLPACSCSPATTPFLASC